MGPKKRSRIIIQDESEGSDEDVMEQDKSQEEEEIENYDESGAEEEEKPKVKKTTKAKPSKPSQSSKAKSTTTKKSQPQKKAPKAKAPPKKSSKDESEDEKSEDESGPEDGPKHKESKREKSDDEMEESKEATKGNETDDEDEDEKLEQTPKESQRPVVPRPIVLPTVQEVREPGKPRPRLMITKIILENFKSYAGAQEVGPFHKCFSSIVGPNGSGKSNVIDAMLFVFGKRAKQLRHNKVSELIHHSDKHPNLTQAKVSVHFQEIIDKEGENAYDVVEGSQMVISRVAFQNNSSKYLIDDRAVKWEEVSEVLTSKGIDLEHNRFLILQGEVEQIALMKPKAPSPHEDGMLEYIEDIIGTNKYVPIIEEKAQQLEALNEERSEKLNRVKLTEKELGNLEGAKNEAEDYLKREKEMIDKKSVLFQLHRTEAEESIAEMTKKKDELEEKLKEKRESMRESTDKLAEMETQFKKEKKEFERIEKEMTQSKAEFAVYERKDIKYREDIKHFKSKEKKLTDTIATERKKVREKVSQLEHTKQDIVRYEKQAEELTKQKEKEEKVLDEIYASLRNETAELQEKLQAKQQELMPHNKKLNEQQSKVDLTKAELELVTSKAEAAHKRLEEATNIIQNIQETLPKKKEELAMSKDRIKQSKNELAAAKQEFDKASQAEVQLAEKIRQLRTQYEESKNTVQESTNRNRLIESVMSAKAKKKLEGVHGRLGDLGTIEKKYDVAISTACGALNNIVVDTTANAEKCVQFLRDNQLGVATFIILDQMKNLSGEMNKSFAPPSQAERLFDLIKFKNDSYKAAFYYALRDTLVADNIDLATKIAFADEKKRYRVVSLEGQLIDTSGTMSGGGNRVASGGMKSTFSGISQEELQQLEQEYNEGSQKLQSLRQKKSELENLIQNLTQQISQLELNIPKIEMDLKQLKTQEEEMKARIPELEQQASTTNPEEQKKIKELQKKLAEFEKELNKTKEVTSKLEKQAQDLQEQIMEIGGVRLKVQKTKVESLTEQIDTANSNVTKAHVQIKTLEKQIAKGEETIEQAEKEMEDLKHEHEKTKEEFKQGESEAQKVLEAYKDCEKLLEEKGNMLKEIQATFEKMKKVVDKFRSQEVDITNQLEDLSRQVKEGQGKAQHWSKKLADLIKQKERTKIDENDMDEALPVLSVEELKQYDADTISNEIAVLEESLTKMKPNMTAIKEYKKKEKDHNERAKELDEVTERRDNIRKDYEALRKKRLDEFMAGFSEITLKLKEMYQMITLGGDAELELVDSLDPFSEGIVFSVRPPKKSWKNISNLSGGEKTLSSLALVFALHHYKPTPLYVMDEIDAALDFKNVSIVANYIKERTKDAQFIIISLRNYMFELADHLVGIYKVNDCSRSVTIAPTSFVIPKPQHARDDVDQKENVENLNPTNNNNRTRNSQIHAT